MNRFTFLALFAFAATALSGCTGFLALNEVDFNNTVVTQINENSMAFEESAKSYNELIPDVVTEKTEFESEVLNTLEEGYKTAKNETAETRSLIELKSKNEEQEVAADLAIENYLSIADEYLTHFSTMLDYYQNGDYKKDVSQVKDLDTNLHASYSTFIEANNDLVEALSPFVSASH